MRIFEIAPLSLPDGKFASAWFDDEKGTWGDERLRLAKPLLHAWDVPRLHIVGGRRRDIPTDVLFNPAAFAVSERVRSALGKFPEIEFLPIDIQAPDSYYVLHVLAAREATHDISFRRNPPLDGNIVQIYSFPPNFEAESDFFRIRQPADSAAGRLGMCVNTIYSSDRGLAAIQEFCGSYLLGRCVTLAPN